MDSSAWDERYAAADLVWSAGPNRWVEAELAALAPGRALDLAAGEGRNASWLAGLGWTVTAADFSGVALDKGRRLAESRHDGRAARISWLQVDLLDYRPPAAGFDLVLSCYLQLPADQRRLVNRRAAAALAPGGVLLVIGHDSANLTGGVGGPQDPAVLFTADQVLADLADVADPAGGSSGGLALRIEKAGSVERPVEGSARPAIDALVRAVRQA
jgi:SAM-dependent methyltransferase